MGGVLIALLYQIPVEHAVTIGGYDSAYVRGFHDPQYLAYGTQSYLAGSDDAVRWSRGSSFLLFPQIGLPATATFRLRGWRPPGVSPPKVTILLNGHTPLATIQTSGEWEEHTITITGGMRKPDDVILELRTSPYLLPNEEREVGVLLDWVHMRVAPTQGFITPYPGQIAYGAIAFALIWVLWQSTRTRAILALLVGILFLWGYRMQPFFYPYPLHWLLPTIDAILFSILVLRFAPALLVRRHKLPYLLLPAGIVLWLVVILRAASNHVTLSVPGVEKDFRVFATRAFDLDKVFQADGFYNLGYPLLLWITHPFTEGNVFLAARLVAALSGALFLLAGYWLAHSMMHLSPNEPHTLGLCGETPRTILPRRHGDTESRTGANREPDRSETSVTPSVRNLCSSVFICGLNLLSPNEPRTLVSGSVTTETQPDKKEKSMAPSVRNLLSLLALLMLIFNPLTTQYALYVGSDMPFAAMTTLSLALLISQISEQSSTQRHRLHTVAIILAGVAAGAAYLIRHPGMVLLPWGIITCLLFMPHGNKRRSALLFVGGFLLAAMPQLIVNTLETGSPLYSQQAKNIWLAVYGDIDWGRWNEVPDSIGLAEIILRDPARFVGNWWHNLTRFVGSGAEDQSQLDNALQLRLLGFPANWLAVVGLLLWVWQGFAKERIHHGDTETRRAGQERDGEEEKIYHGDTETRRAGQERDGEDEQRWRNVVYNIFLQMTTLQRRTLALLLFVALYVAGICVTFILPRFFLPLVPIYAAAAAWSVYAFVGDGACDGSTTTQDGDGACNGSTTKRDGDGAGNVATTTQDGDGAGNVATTTQDRDGAGNVATTTQDREVAYNVSTIQSLLAIGLLLLLMLHNGFSIGTRTVLDQQPSDEVALIQLTRDSVPEGEKVIVLVPPTVPIDKYSAIAHQVVPLPDAPDLSTALQQAKAQGVYAVVWDSANGDFPLAARDVGGGRYRLYVLNIP